MIHWLYGRTSSNISQCQSSLSIIPLTGERLEAGIKNSLILQSDEAVVITAHEEFEDTLANGIYVISSTLTSANVSQLYEYDCSRFLMMPIIEVIIIFIAVLS